MNKVRRIGRQMILTGLAGFFIALGVTRILHRPGPNEVYGKIIYNGLIGLGIGAVVGLLMYQFKASRMTLGHDESGEADSGSENEEEKIDE